MPPWWHPAVTLAVLSTPSYTVTHSPPPPPPSPAAPHAALLFRPTPPPPPPPLPAAAVPARLQSVAAAMLLLLCAVPIPSSPSTSLACKRYLCAPPGEPGYHLTTTERCSQRTTTGGSGRQGAVITCRITSRSQFVEESRWETNARRK